MTGELSIRKFRGFLVAILITGVLNAVVSAQVQTTPPRKTISLPNGALPIPEGPFEPNRDSIKKNYKTPKWFVDAKFGIMMHWGLYSVPAKQSEWYATHMYNNPDIANGVELLGNKSKLNFRQDDASLVIELPPAAVADAMPFCLKIKGLKL